MSAGSLGWLGIIRVGFVQASLGAMVITATSTLNRIMVIEASLPAIVPGLLVGLHYAVQVMRPCLGHGSDTGGRRTPWIMGGVAVLALGTLTAALATGIMASEPVTGVALAVLGYGLIGLGVGAAGTSLLVFLASAVDERRRAAAAAIVWMLMIAGFVVTSASVGHLLDPYSPMRLVGVTAGICALALTVAVSALSGLEGAVPAPTRDRGGDQARFGQALAEVWAEPQSRHFALFVFVSMLAYSAQQLVLEPFAGAVFGLPPGATARLSGLQHGGLLTGMILVAAAGLAFPGRTLGTARTWTLGGCVASGLGMAALAAAALVGPGWPLAATVFASGMANGAFAIAAITAMMQLVGRGQAARQGVRMGVWGGAQAVAFGLGGVSGAGASDLGRLVMNSVGAAYAAVFLAQAALFLWAALLSTRVFERSVASGRVQDDLRPAVAGG